MRFLGGPEDFPRWHLRRAYEKALSRVERATAWEIVALAMLPLIAALTAAVLAYRDYLLSITP